MVAAIRQLHGACGMLAGEKQVHLFNSTGVIGKLSWKVGHERNQTHSRPYTDFCVHLGYGPTIHDIDCCLNGNHITPNAIQGCSAPDAPVVLPRGAALFELQAPPLARSPRLVLGHRSWLQDCLQDFNFKRGSCNLSPVRRASDPKVGDLRPRNGPATNSVEVWGLRALGLLPST